MASSSSSSSSEKTNNSKTKERPLLIPPPLCPLKKGGVDVWRGSMLRYMGYANEVGEAFRPIYPRYVYPSYGIAFLYVLGDTGDKTISSYKQGEGWETALKRGSDAFLWQTFASVVIPGKIIYAVTAGVKHAVESKNMAGSFFQSRPIALKWAPTMVGLATIPFIIHPIDRFVDYMMDETLRKFT